MNGRPARVTDRVCGSCNASFTQLAADAVDRPFLAGPIRRAAVGDPLVLAIALGQVGSPHDVQRVAHRSPVLASYDPRNDKARPVGESACLGRSIIGPPVIEAATHDGGS